MNERIKDMWVESTGSIWPRPGKFTAGEYDWHLEKFAELIVRECVDIIQRESEKAIRNNTYMGDDVPASVTQWKIKEHFGV